ncbi:MAG TPA: ATP-binding protein [Candidatus Sulfopaludibacter sp.]|nr:ATP-binding protein [Candidatus Sulfopaludibacter sp.]
MADPQLENCLADIFLRQAPACHWIAGPRGGLLRIYGDSLPLFGKPACELTGKPLTQTLGDEAAAAWMERFSRAMAGESQTLRERRGNTIWYVSIFPVSVEGAIRYAGGLARDITPWAVAEQELRHAVLGALRAQEFERTMASKFLHDSVGQNLTALGLQLDLIRMDLGTHPEICRRIGEIQKLLEIMMEEVRDYSYELNPSTVERAGLRAALDRLAQRLHERFPGAIRVNVDPSLKIDPKIASAMYQVAQEVVQNAVQHAACSAIEIAVKSSRIGPALEVRDNGRGFDPSDLAGGFRGLGLLSMEHYAAQAGLDLSISSNRETGTTVRAGVPEGD